MIEQKLIVSPRTVFPLDEGVFIMEIPNHLSCESAGYVRELFEIMMKKTMRPVRVNHSKVREGK